VASTRATRLAALALPGRGEPAPAGVIEELEVASREDGVTRRSATGADVPIGVLLSNGAKTAANAAANAS